MIVRIGAREVSVVHTALRGLEGAYDRNTHTIHVSTLIPWGSDLWLETVLHEMEHAYYHTSGFAEPAHEAIAGIAYVVRDNITRLLREKHS